jgi:cytochrome c oxidase assembly protein Cox11
MTVQEFVNIDKDLQTVQDISDVNIIILIYLFIKLNYKFYSGLKVQM